MIVIEYTVIYSKRVAIPLKYKRTLLPLPDTVSRTLAFSRRRAVSRPWDALLLQPHKYSTYVHRDSFPSADFVWKNGRSLNTGNPLSALMHSLIALFHYARICRLISWLQLGHLFASLVLFSAARLEPRV